LCEPPDAPAEDAPLDTEADAETEATDDDAWDELLEDEPAKDDPDDEPPPKLPDLPADTLTATGRLVGRSAASDERPTAPLVPEARCPSTTSVVTAGICALPRDATCAATLCKFPKPSLGTPSPAESFVNSN